MARTSEPHLLVIEDNDEDYVATVRALGQSGRAFTPQRCATADEALAYLRRRREPGESVGLPHPHLILLDLNLPGTDGRDLLAAIKGDPKLKAIPVVVLTTSRDPKDIADCYRLGANSYQIKPVDYARFKEAMRLLAIYWLETVLLPEL